jgi:hypothetical protein
VAGLNRRLLSDTEKIAESKVFLVYVPPGSSLRNVNCVAMLAWGMVKLAALSPCGPHTTEALTQSLYQTVCAMTGAQITIPDKNVKTNDNKYCKDKLKLDTFLIDKIAPFFENPLNFIIFIVDNRIPQSQ